MLLNLPALSELLVEVQDKIRDIHQVILQDYCKGIENSGYIPDDEPFSEPENALRKSYEDAIREVIQLLENPNQRHAARVCKALERLKALLEDEVPF